MRVVLTGFRGTGKTLVGKRLSHLLDIPFIDTDSRIEEAAGMTIHEMMMTHGEAYFRRREREVISSLEPGDAVISTGGGAILDPENVKDLRQGSIVFLLEADEKTIEDRIAYTTRPPLTKLALRDEIHALLAAREPLYIASADICISTTGKQVNEVCLGIQRILSEGTADQSSRDRVAEFIRGTGISSPEIPETIDRLVGDSFDPYTRFYGIAGNPCTHSRSPPLFNALFDLYRMNAFYTRFQWPDIDEILSHARTLGMKGLSVTIPFKEQILPLIDCVDAHAEKIGAVNTVVFCGRRTHGFNTDWLGIRGPLVGHRNAQAAVLGAGGAAAAAVYALLDLEMDITVLNRTVERGRLLAERFGCHSAPLEAFASLSPEVVINATPVGMAPDRRSPVPEEQLKPGMTVFDLVYTPSETPLLRAAAAAGCTTIPGTEMFIRQACAQFRHFTGILVPEEQVRRLLV